MLRLFLMVFEKYGLGILNLALLGFVSWRLFTNHLKHISDAITENATKLTEIGKEVTLLGKKVAKLEGQIE